MSDGHSPRVRHQTHEGKCCQVKVYTLTPSNNLSAERLPNTGQSSLTTLVRRASARQFAGGRLHIRCLAMNKYLLRIYCTKFPQTEQYNIIMSELKDNKMRLSICFGVLNTAGWREGPESQSWIPSWSYGSLRLVSSLRCVLCSCP